MSTDELSTLNRGDTVTVLGEFDDGGDLGVQVKDCKAALIGTGNSRAGSASTRPVWGSEVIP